LAKLDPVFEISGTNQEKFIKLEELLQDSETGKKESKNYVPFGIYFNLLVKQKKILN